VGFKLVAPDFEVRKDEKPENSYRWAHIGNDDYYFAFQEPHLGVKPEKPRKSYENFGVNHVGLCVSDLSQIEQKLVDSGYKRGIETPDERFRKRRYFYDKAGFEWELVEYSSNDPGEKYLYE
jgi:hypothetical protein